MTAFMFGPKEKAALQAAQEQARQNPITAEIVNRGYNIGEFNGDLSLADRTELAKRGTPAMRPSSEHVMLPNGFSVAITYEDQPCGMCLHMSMSSPKRGKVPTPEAVTLVLDALGLARPIDECEAVWLEEFEPGRKAVNVLVLTKPKLIQ